MRGGVKALELMWGVEERPSTWPQLEKMEMENNLFGYVVSNTARLQRGDVDGVLRGGGVAFWESPEVEASSMYIVCKVTVLVVITRRVRRKRRPKTGSRAREEILVQEGTKEGVGTVELEGKQGV